MKEELREVRSLKEGDLIKWQFRDWREVSKVTLQGRWIYLEFKGFPVDPDHPFTIQSDTEFPWRRS